MKPRSQCDCICHTTGATCIVACCVENESAVDTLCRLVDEAGLTVRFGLRQQGHIETVRQMRAEGKSWEEIGKRIGWQGNAVEKDFTWEMGIERHVGLAEALADHARLTREAAALHQANIDDRARFVDELKVCDELNATLTRQLAETVAERDALRAKLEAWDEALAETVIDWRTKSRSDELRERVAALTAPSPITNPAQAGNEGE